MASFADRLKDLRKNKKLSQKELADFLGMKRENISNYERGTITNIPSDVLTKLSNLFDVSIDYLMGESAAPQQSKNNDSIAKQIMLRSDTSDISEKDAKEIEKEIERFLNWRLDEIRRERSERN